MIETLPASAPVPGDVADARVDGPDGLVLAVEACGICGTDLHILAGESYRPELPFVLGHEPVGVVIDAGRDAEGWLGRRVAVSLFTGDGTCPLCAAGDERLCEHLVAVTGIQNAWGGFAERLAIHARQAVAVPDELGSDEAAALVDAGPTAVNALRSLRGSPGRIAVIGGGPVGWLLAELARGEGRDVIVVEHNAIRRSGLRALGHEAIEQLADLQGPIDVVADCTGSPEVPPWALARLRARGRLLVVGYTQVPAFDLAPIARKELSIAGVRSGSRDDLAEALARAARGDLRPPPVRCWPLAEIPAAFAALRGGEVDGKAVIVIPHANAGGGA